MIRTHLYVLCDATILAELAHGQRIIIFYQTGSGSGYTLPRSGIEKNVVRMSHSIRAVKAKVLLPFLVNFLTNF